MTAKSNKSTLVRGSSSVDILREQGIDVDPVSEGSLTKDIIIDTARKIRAMRKLAGLSQSELARIANMAHTDISRIESGLGRKGPSIETIYRLARACENDCNLNFTPSLGHSSTKIDSQ